MSSLANLLFVLIALGVAAIASALWLLHSRQPSGLQHGIRTFRREMDALAPARRRAPVRQPQPEPVLPSRAVTSRSATTRTPPSHTSSVRARRTSAGRGG